MIKVTQTAVGVTRHVWFVASQVIYVTEGPNGGSRIRFTGDDVFLNVTEPPEDIVSLLRLHLD